MGFWSSSAGCKHCVTQDCLGGCDSVTHLKKTKQHRNFFLAKKRKKKRQEQLYQWQINLAIHDSLLVLTLTVVILNCCRFKIFSNHPRDRWPRPLSLPGSRTWVASRNKSGPSPSVRHVPGSAEAHGGLQKTHLLRKEASSSTDSTFWGAFCLSFVFFRFFCLIRSETKLQCHLHQAANSCWHLKIKWRNKTSLKCIFKLMHNLRGRKEKAVNGSVKYFSVCSCMTFSWGFKDVRVWFVILYVIFIYFYISTLTWGYNNSAKWYSWLCHQQRDNK